MEPALTTATVPPHGASYLGGEELGARIRATREGIALSPAALADLARVPLEDLRLLEADARAAGPTVVAQVCHALGIPLATLLAQEFCVPDSPVLRNRPGHDDPRRQSLGLAIARGLYLARSWRAIEEDLRDTNSSSSTADDFGRRDLNAMRAYVGDRISTPQTAADGVRRFFEYTAHQPFHVRERLHSLGILALSLNFPVGTPFDGCFQRDPDGTPIVLLNLTRRPRAHASFVAAHELGHLLLGERRYEIRGQADDLDEERYCDEFADHLLLPLDAVQELARSKIAKASPAELVRTVHELFGVSRSVVRRQLSRAGVAISKRAMDRAYKALAPVGPRPRTKAVRTELPQGMQAALVAAVEAGVVSPQRVQELKDVLRY